MTPTLSPPLRMERPNPPDLARQFIDEDVTLVFDYQIAANAQVIGLQQPISSDGDFYLCAIQASSVIQIRPDNQEDAGNVALRFSDDIGYRLSDNYIGLNFFTPMSGNPWPFVLRHAHLFRAGTKIVIDMQELSGGAGGSPSNVQIAFRGRYRYRAQGGA